MYPFIIRLIEIFKSKKDILERLEKLVEESNKGLKLNETINAELSELTDRLMKLNNELVNYEDNSDRSSIRDAFGINISKNLSQCGLNIHKAYLELMQVVEREQYFLDKLFIPIIEEIKRKKLTRERLTFYLNNFKNLIRIIDVDIEYFYILLHNIKENGFITETKEKIDRNKEIVKNNILVSLSAGDLKEALYWAKYGRGKDWLSLDEYNWFNTIIISLTEKEFQESIDKLEEPLVRRILAEKEFETLRGIIIRFKEEHEAPFRKLGEELSHFARAFEKGLKNRKNRKESLNI